MSKLVDYINAIGKDKVIYFCVSLVVALVAGCLVKICGGDKYAIIAAAWFIGLITGIAKELYDEWKYKGADERDFKADAIGTTVGTLIVTLLVV